MFSTSCWTVSTWLSCPFCTVRPNRIPIIYTSHGGACNVRHFLQKVFANLVLRD
jgi:hypothetical protein